MSHIFNFCLITFLLSLSKLFHFMFFRKTWKWKAWKDGLVKLKAGKYGIIIFGDVSPEDLQKIQLSLSDYDDKENIEISDVPFISSGYSNFQKFSNVGNFQLENPKSVLLSIRGLRNIDVGKSRLFIKNFLFPRGSGDEASVGIVKKIDIKFLLLVIFLNIASISIIIYLINNHQGEPL